MPGMSYHRHGLELVTGNLCILAGLALLVLTMALAAARPAGSGAVVGGHGEGR